MQAKVKAKPRYNPDYADTDSLPLRPDQLNVPGGNTRAPSAAGPNGPSGSDYPENIEHSKKNFFSFANVFKKQEYATFTGEPARTSLTDPPPGYLTPSPDQPYGVGPEQKQYKIPTVADRANAGQRHCAAGTEEPGSIELASDVFCGARSCSNLRRPTLV